ncbi:MAG: putative toxin-antitoxin system toxin component, PIN family [Nanoarchaeota archaeon]|nr:putative toxin-antitoxin system toxin component, PIN family [Nanoarchaeota archaeon]
MKITLDTNILVSASFWTGDSLKLIDLIDQKIIECVLSDKIFDEYKKAINSEGIIEKTKRKNLVLIKTVHKVMEDCILVKPEITLDIVKEDPDDNKILECAVAGNADFIITKDNHLQS